jgi:hypothetical protein
MQTDSPETRKREVDTLSAVVVEGMRVVSRTLIDIAPALSSLEAPDEVLSQVAWIVADLAGEAPSVEADLAGLAALDPTDTGTVEKASALAEKVKGLVADSRELARLVREYGG